MNREPIPQQRIMEKLDRLLEAQDREGAERHLHGNVFAHGGLLLQRFFADAEQTRLDIV